MSAHGAPPPIDATDRRIILATQAGLPLVAHPYHAVAESLGIAPAEVMARMTRMQSTGIIRRIGVVPNHYHIGYRANGMSVWDVPDARVAERTRLRQPLLPPPAASTRLAVQPLRHGPRSHP
jgi:DNA-binding Lrp family transcriptional regulator